MLDRLQRKLMGISILLITAIMALVGGISVVLFYSNLKENYLSSFFANTGNIFAGFHNNPVMDSDLLNSYLGHGYSIYIRDGENSTSYLSDSLLLNPASVEDAFDARAETYPFANGKNAFVRFEFPQNGETYHVCYGYVYYGTFYIKIITVCSLQILKSQIKRTASIVALLCFMAIFLLSFLAYMLIRRLLEPVAAVRKSQSDFIAAASHELKSPLAVIVSGISALKQEDRISEDGRRQIALAETECFRMSRLVSDLLSLSKADAKVANYTFVECQVEDLLISCYEHFEQLAEKKGLQLTVVFPEEPLPPVYLDKNRVFELLSILTDNAISYTKSGSVTLATSLTGHTLELRVTDTGIGIPDDLKMRVFERFFSVDASHSDKSHHGLGLAIAREIVLAHRGTITVTDTPEGGTTFTVLLRV